MSRAGYPPDMGPEGGGGTHPHDTMGYSRQAILTHPTGMFSCLLFQQISFRRYKKNSCEIWMASISVFMSVWWKSYPLVLD